jgi:hypothetical protein
MGVVEEDCPGGVDVTQARINASALVIIDKLRKNDQYPITSKRLLSNLIFNMKQQSCPYMNEWKESYSKASLNAENTSLEISAFGGFALYKLNGYDNRIEYIHCYKR